MAITKAGECRSAALPVRSNGWVPNPRKISALASGALLSTLLGVCAGIGNHAAFAAAIDVSYNEGVKLYTARNYKAAAAQFETAMKTMPNSPDAIYYCALCNQLSGNRTRAKQLFEYLLNRFPQSRVAPMAQTALGQLSALSQAVGAPGVRTGSSKNSGGSGRRFRGDDNDSDLAAVPDLVRIPFEKHGNDIIVQVVVNNRSVPFILDTGASSVAIGYNHLKEWGINKTEGSQKFKIGGVGDGFAVGWNQNLDLKLGPIFRRDFPCTIQDSMPTEPLLGQTFLKSFNVNIDDSTRMVLLAKKAGSAAAQVAHRSYYAKEVPFKRNSSGHIVVDAAINGKPLKMIFDTGAESTCVTTSDWQKMGFSIPSDAKETISRGVLGDSKTYVFPVERVQCGPIVQDNFIINVIESDKSIPLLGMSFYGKFKYAIDTNRNMIVFSELNQ